MESFEDKYRKVHKRLSLVKSFIRIASCAFVLFMPATTTPFILIGGFALGFMIAEWIGIAEEMI